MALTRYQKESIETALSLDTYFTDLKQLDATTKKLKEALTEPVSEEHEFFMVRNLFLKPNAYLQQLESGKAITIGEVQQYFIEHMTMFLTVMSEEAKIRFENLQWDQAELLKSISEEDYKLSFVSLKTAEDGWDSPWQLPPLQGNRIYTQNFYLFEPEEFIEGIGKVKLPKKPVVDVSVTFEPSVKTIILEGISPDSAQDETAFIENLKPLAQIEAKEYAARTALSHLAKHRAISRNQKETALVSETFKELVTHVYYFENLKRKHIKFNHIENLTPQEVDNLTDLIVIDLMENNVCGIEQARTLKPHERELVTHPAIFAQLKAGNISIRDVKGRSEERCRFVSFTPIANLIQSGKLNVKDAFLLRTLLKPFFYQHEIYREYFMTQPIDWKHWIAVKDYHFRLLADNDIARLVARGTVSIASVVELSELDIQNLARTPRLIPLLESNLIGITDILTLPPSELIVREYSSRLYATVFNFPSVINKKEDTTEELVEELMTMEDPTYYEEILTRFIFLLQGNIQESIKTGELSDDYQPLLIGVTSEILNNPVDCYKALNQLVEIANNVIKEDAIEKYVKNDSPSSNASKDRLFSPKRKRETSAQDNSELEDRRKRRRTETNPNNSKLLNLCEQIAKLLPLCIAPKALFKVRIGN